MCRGVTPRMIGRDGDHLTVDGVRTKTLAEHARAADVLSYRGTAAQRRARERCAACDRTGHTADRCPAFADDGGE